MISSQRVQVSSKILYLATFSLLLLVLPTAFIHEKISRVLFYWCGYLSLTGLLTNIITEKKPLNNKNIPVVFLLLSLLFLSWSALSEYLSGDNLSELLYTPGKRWLIASVIAFYILNGKEELKTLPNKFLIISIMAAAFIAASAFGIIQGINSDERILLGINRATLTAYAYSAFTLAFSSIIAITSTKKNKYFIQSAILIVSTYVIFLTQTRAAMFLHPALGLLLLFSWMYRDKVLNLKVLAISIFSLMAVIAVNSKIIIDRYDSTMREFREYNRGNDFTSLGARFSMWKLGVISFKESPFGQSESHRNNEITEYLHDANEKSAAIKYLEVHLHNEFIQYASIFGIFGVIILFLFFFILIFKVSQPPMIGPVGISTISILLYGLTDVLLTSIELIVILTTTIILSSMVCYCQHGKPEK